MNTPNPPAENTADFIPPKVRTFIYSIVDPVAKLLVAYGIVEDAKVALWVGLAGSLLGMGTAIAYRPTGPR